MVNKQRKPYRADFKDEAVQRIQAGERVTLLSRELLVPEGTLYRWCLEAEQRAGGKPGEQGKPESPAEAAALQAQIRELQAALGRRTMELDFFQGALRRLAASGRTENTAGEKTSGLKSAAGWNRRAD
jgi:transposase-like protein